MPELAAKIFIICECIDHCFAFDLWCEDFAPFVQPEDMLMGQDRAFEVVSDATRLMSFLALRKMDDFFGGVRPMSDDVVVTDLEIDAERILGTGLSSFLTATEREDINKGVAHLTNRAALEDDSEVELSAIISRSLPILRRLLSALRDLDTRDEATHWLEKTGRLVGETGSASLPP